MSTTLNMLDLIFIAFAIIFVTVAFFRGFVKEAFALINWIMAILVSTLLGPYLALLLKSYSKNFLLINIISQFIIFIAVFIGTAFATSNLCETLQDKMPKYFDRSIGIFYGLLKTLFVFGLIYSIAHNILILASSRNVDNKSESSKEMPDWLRDAKFYSLIKVSGDALDPMVKKSIEFTIDRFDEAVSKDPKNKKFKDLDDKIDEISEKVEVKEDKNEKPQSDKKTLEDKKNKPESKKESVKDIIEKEENSGYDKKDIEKMNRLIEIIDKK